MEKRQSTPTTLRYDPKLYLDHNSIADPCLDHLLGMLPNREFKTMIDLGCGPGEKTVRIHKQLKVRQTLAVDVSPEMLDVAQENATGENIRFEIGDIGKIEGSEKFDLVMSLNALQVIPDHPSLFSAINNLVAPGGLLAFQIPWYKDMQPFTARIYCELFEEEPYRRSLPPNWSLKRILDPDVLDPDEYAEMLDRLGFKDIDIRLKVFTAELPSWEFLYGRLESTMLVRAKKAMSSEIFESFKTEYKKRLMAVLKSKRPHFYAFKFMQAVARLP